MRLKKVRSVKRAIIVVGFVFCLFGLVVVVDYEATNNQNRQSNNDHIQQSSVIQSTSSILNPSFWIKSEEQVLEDDDETLPLVLLYTDEYYSRDEHNMLKFLHDTKCEWKCRYTMDKRKWNVSRSVVIREQFPSGTYPPHSSHDQRIILMLPEAPGRKAVRDGLKKIPKHYVNLTFGYMREFDFYKPYDAMIKQNTSLREWRSIKRHLALKKKGAFIVFSNCESDSRRELYIEALKRFFPIDTFGFCGDQKQCDDKCMLKNLHDYHFYVSFENNVCEDYFSEKYFRIKDLILPLVLKDEVYRGKVPDNSYIAVDQFDSLQQLASHLQLLQSNHSHYFPYFEWTKEYSLKHASLWGEQYCRVCQNAYDSTFQKSYENIAEWFGPERRCDNDLVKRLLEKEERVY